MSEPMLLPVKPGTLNAKDKKALSAAGIIVIEHDHPEEIRLLRPGAELESSDLLRCAMAGLMDRSGSYGVSQRETFAKAVYAALMEKAGETK